MKCKSTVNTCLIFFLKITEVKSAINKGDNHKSYFKEKFLEHIIWRFPAY